jgi:dipeptidyl aminopeptidase/acylaminoacyl peptidase
VAGVIALAAPTNLETLVSSAPHLKADMQKYLNGANPKSASPVFSATPKSSPTFLIHGQQDVLVPPSQSKEYQELLQELKVPVKLQTYAGMDHNVFKPTSQLTQMLRDMTAFLLYVENKSIKP